MANLPTIFFKRVANPLKFIKPPKYKFVSKNEYKDIYGDNVTYTFTNNKNIVETNILTFYSTPQSQWLRVKMNNIIIFDDLMEKLNFNIACNV